MKNAFRWKLLQKRLTKDQRTSVTFGGKMYNYASFPINRRISNFK